MGFLTQLLQQRHQYYRALLVVEVLALLSLSSLQRLPRLVGVMYLLITGVCVVLDTPLLRRNRLRVNDVSSINGSLRHRIAVTMRRRRVIAVGWLLCLAIELLWQSALVFDPKLAVQLSAPHLVVWLSLILQMLWGLIKALAEEPLFNGPVLMGAAAGYLLVGFAGGIALNSLLVLDPGGFQLPDPAGGLPAAIAHAPTILGAAFGCLTTLGSPVLRLDHLSVQIAATAITVVGQLYLAIMIAGVLGKPRPAVHQRQNRARHRLSSQQDATLRRR